MHVRQDLKLDVARVLKILLDIERSVSESLFRLQARRLKLLGEGNRVVGNAHSASPASRDGLDDDGKPDLLGYLGCLNFVLERAITARDNGDPRLGNGFTGLCLVAHLADGLGLRTDKNDIAGLALLCEFGILG